MPINTDLNTAPYFDDFDIEKQYYKVLFKPGFAVQARELTQLQTMLQSQIEQFGDNIFKEGSIIKGCNFTTLGDLRYVKVSDGIDPTQYITSRALEELVEGSGEFTLVDTVYELEGASSGLKANIVAATRGFVSRPPDLNTFYINYLNASGVNKEFLAGEELIINSYKYNVEAAEGDNNLPFASETDLTAAIQVIVSATDGTGRAYGIQSSPGIVFQKGHFLFAEQQTLVVSKYDNVPDNVSVGYKVQERLISALADNSLYDNANGSNNENAAGADRLNLVPTLVAVDTPIAESDPTFFALIRFQGGNEVSLRDVSQYNVLGEELAKRTYEESGNYILKDFAVKTDRRGNDVQALIGTGTAYVKGYRVENSGERAFTIDQITTSEVQQNQPVSLNYGSYVDVISYAGKVNISAGTQLNLLRSDFAIIGTTFVSNVTPTRIYIYGTRMIGGNRFSDVYRIDLASGEVNIGNGVIVPVIKESSKTPLIFDTGMFSLRATTDTIIPVRAQINDGVPDGSNIITIPAGANADFAVDNSDVLVIDATNVPIPVTNVATSNGDTNLLVTVAPGANPNCTVYFNKRLQSVLPHTKTVQSPFVSVGYVDGQTKYNLGFPDVFEIVSITNPVTQADYTDSFRLRTNQKDQFYDLSYMEAIQGRPKPANGDTLVIGIRVFELNSSSGQYFFTINSYPADPQDPTFTSANIPVYEGTNGSRYNLRECFDFRPYVDKDTGADFATIDPLSPSTVAVQTVGTTAPTFATDGLGLIPAVNATITTDIESYLSRIDLITADSYGEINIIKGKEERFAIPPKVGSDKLAISQILVPGFPALSAQEAADQGKGEYSVKAKAVGIKNYTMKDIKGLERKIDNLVYYISLSQLESATQDLTILDENGLSRFKNGFIADPFNDLSLADVRNAKFSAAVPFNEKILMPAVKTFPLDLKFKEGTGISTFPPTNDPKVATLGRNADISILNQPFASEFRNCVSNFWKYSGDGVVSPPYDAAYDTTTNPLNLEVDLVTPFQDFVENLQQFVPLTDTTTSTRMDFEDFEIDERGRGFFGGTGQQVETTRSRQLTTTEQTDSNAVGEFVTNFQFQPYMASRDIKIYMSGLRPNTRHYFFFDQVDVNQHMVQGTLVNNADDIERNGLFDPVGGISSDANGVLRAVFRIPDATFFVGDRVLDVVDVDQYASIESGSTSRGFVTYRAYNFSVEKAALTTVTRAPDFDISTVTTTRNLPRRPRGGRDPLAQTFFIKRGMGKGSNSVFLSKVDLFFKRRSEVNGVTVMIREVINGYPSNIIVPFSKVHFEASQVLNDDNAEFPTTFTFEAPVRLDVEKEYCIVVMPDANDPNYLIFTSKVGGTDLTPGLTQGQSIVQDWGDGVLFTSTNNRAWKSYQDEDIKFNLYRHEFNTPAGRVTMTTRDSEFLTVNDWNGRFKVGELLYQETGVEFESGLPDGSNLLDIGTGLNAGDYVLVRNNANTRRDIFRVTGPGTGAQVVLNKPSTFTGAFATPIVAGRISYYNQREPNEIHLDSSSAVAGKVFTAGTNVIGFDTGTTANLVSVDNINMSYVQPMIMKANDSVSSTDLSGSFTNPDDINVPYTLPMNFGNNNHFNKNGVVLYSKSNDLAGARDFDIIIDMENQANVTSTAFVDIEASKLLAYTYKITNDPATTSTFVSKTIELAEDLDAEDLHLIITGYKPNGTDIKTYIKAQNEFDSAEFDDTEWIELELFEGVGVFSSTANINDYKEYKYRVPATAKNGTALTYQSVAGTFDGYRKFAIRIDMLSTSIHSVPTLQDYRGIALT